MEIFSPNLFNNCLSKWWLFILLLLSISLYFYYYLNIQVILLLTWTTISHLQTFLLIYCTILSLILEFRHEFAFLSIYGSPLYNYFPCRNSWSEDSLISWNPSLISTGFYQSTFPLTLAYLFDEGIQ